MQWQSIFAIVMGTSLVAAFVKFYSDYMDSKKKLIDLEYKNAKNEIKEQVKDDSIDAIIARIIKRFK